MPATQQSLFDTEPAPWELDDAATALVATVVLSGGPAGEFDYLVPAEMIGGPRPERNLEAGRRVRVPLGRSNRSVVGYCVDVAMKPAGGKETESGRRAARSRAVVVARHVACHAMDGGLLPVSLGAGFGSGGARTRTGDNSIMSRVL